MVLEKWPPQYTYGAEEREPQRNNLGNGGVPYFCHESNERYGLDATCPTKVPVLLES